MLIPAPERREQMSPSEPGWSAMSTVRQSSIEAYNPSFCSASLPFAGSSAMILARPSKTARARMFTRALPRDWATWERVPGLLASWTVNCLARGMSLPPEELSDQPKERIEIAVRHPFLERDDAIVGDLDVLGADPGARPPASCGTAPRWLPAAAGTAGSACSARNSRRRPSPDP